MTQTFTTNSNNDIFIGPNGNLSISTGIEGVKFACETAAKAQLGEMVLAINQGVANFQTVWRNAANVAQFEASVRAALLSVEGVTGILDFEVMVQQGVTGYRAVIQTIYGNGVVNSGGFT